MPDDPYRHWRSLDGTYVKVHLPKLTENVDGQPLGVEVEEVVAMLVLPAAVEEDHQDRLGHAE